ncbi:UNVERIFIED_CONTAM: LIM domain-containing protein PLIM2a [Sesamum radiatum]|uniref:LIM domain-containing protein PLIM2a n=1 Tax=Sesamum radiatum TaxID=300843 RepID=A0AAW2KQF7_SESRA
MASFTGTLDKCKACDKTVYFVDLLSADGATFHKSCFKCSHCKGTLVMSNYSSMDGVLYCKPHFEQLFKESGNFSKNFQTGAKPERENSLTRTPSKLSALFSGTQDKCPACNKTVYPLEKPAEAEAGSDEPEQSKENEEKEDEDEGKEPDEPEHPQQQS